MADYSSSTQPAPPTRSPSPPYVDENAYPQNPNTKRPSTRSTSILGIASEKVQNSQASGFQSAPASSSKKPHKSRIQTCKNMMLMLDDVARELWGANEEKGEYGN